MIGNIHLCTGRKLNILLINCRCQEGKTEVVKLLLEQKANIHVKCGKTPQTALQIAQKNPTQNAEIISLLQQQELKEVQNSHYKVFALFQEHFSPLLRYHYLLFLTL